MLPRGIPAIGWNSYRMELLSRNTPIGVICPTGQFKVNSNTLPSHYVKNAADEQHRVYSLQKRTREAGRCGARSQQKSLAIQPRSPT